MRAFLASATAGLSLYVSYVDSGAGQCMLGIESAFIMSTLRTCTITIEGIGGTLLVRGIGTARILVIDEHGEDVYLLVHNCLLSSGVHNLLSLSQIQSNPATVVVLDNEAPSVIVGDSVGGCRRIPLRLANGMFELPFTVLSDSDLRGWTSESSTIPECALSQDGQFDPPTTCYPKGHPAAGTVLWKRTVHQVMPAAYVLRQPWQDCGVFNAGITVPGLGSGSIDFCHEAQIY